METLFVLLVVGSGSQVTLGWEDCCGEDGRGPACFYIRERETTPATGTSVEPNSDDHFPLPQKPRRSVILMTLISFSHFLLISVIHNKQTKIRISHMEKSPSRLHPSCTGSDIFF